MSLSDKQAEFLLDVCKLIVFATQQGFKVTGGELYRPYEIQLVYFHSKKVDEENETIVLKDHWRRSKTMNSKHLSRLAIDLNFFQDKVFVNGMEKEDAIKILKPIGEYWNALNKDNVWGGSWGWDAPHFERK